MSLCKIFALLVASKHKRKRQRRKQPFISETQQKAASRKSFRGKQQPRQQGSKQQPRQQRQGKRNLFLLASLFCCLFFGKQPSKPSSKQPSSKQPSNKQGSKQQGKQRPPSKASSQDKQAAEAERGKPASRQTSQPVRTRCVLGRTYCTRT